jgi:hypothetical protein
MVQNEEAVSWFVLTLNRAGGGSAGRFALPGGVRRHEPTLTLQKCNSTF